MHQIKQNASKSFNAFHLQNAKCILACVHFIVGVADSYLLQVGSVEPTPAPGTLGPSDPALILMRAY